MKRIIYKLSFVPKIPIPHVIVDGIYNYDGSFFLVSESPLILTDFLITDAPEFKKTVVHIGHPFEVFLNADEMQLISFTHSHFSQHLASNMYINFYNDYTLYLIPIMQSRDQNEWDSTISWMKSFVEPPIIYDLYHNILCAYDKKNQGEKLGEFFVQNGEEINKFVHFIMSLEDPVKDYVENNPPLRDKKLSKQEFVAFFASLKLQESLISRITRKENPRRKYSIIRSIAFNLNLNVLNKTKRNLIKNLECEDPSNLRQNLPLLDIVNIDNRSTAISNFPISLNRSHQRILEVLKNRDIISDIYCRIPDKFTPPDPVGLYSMELCHLVPISPVHLSLAYLINRISDQFYPISKGHLSIIHATNKAAEIIKNNLLYRFKDLRLLRLALTDITLIALNRKTLPINPRLITLGSAVLNFIISDIIFLANKTESVIRMTKMRSLILGGEFIRNVANKMNLAKCFISKHGGLTVILPNHTAKKLILAIFGAIFLDSNLSSCFTAFKYLVMIDDKAIAESMFNLSPIGLQTLEFITRNEFGVQNDILSAATNSTSLQSVSSSNISSSGSLQNINSNDLQLITSSSNPQLNSNNNANGSSNTSLNIPSSSAISVISSLLSEFVENNDHPIKYQNVYDVIKITFPSNYLPLFQAAFTHSSCSKSFTSNEKLIFVGEAFTKMIITMLAYRCFPTADSDQLEFVVYEKLKQLGLLAYEKQISTITVVQPGFEDKLQEPYNDGIDDDEILSSLHCETLFAVVAAIIFACGFNTAYQFIHQDLLGLNWFFDINVDNIKQKELEEKIKKKSGVQPHYFQYLVDGKYYSFMSVGNFRVQCVGVAKDPIVSKQDLINSVDRAFENDPSIILTSKEYEDIEMHEANDDFQQLQYTVYE